ncbi:MAG: (2Fe-2S)-binding protein [Myxococcales bacterium]|nr:MAG: (2Fe-2S)-binding protein [Myxococcales bacterium]
MVRLTVNGVAREVDVPDDVPLLWVLREELGLTGTKFGCGVALCGACTVHVDGAMKRSCVVPVGLVAGREVVTIEGLTGPAGEALREAWIAAQAPQCGYCQPGQIMSAAALLKKVPRPTDDDIDAVLSANLCRCGTYPRIRRAVHLAAGRLAGKGEP